MCQHRPQLPPSLQAPPLPPGPATHRGTPAAGPLPEDRAAPGGAACPTTLHGGPCGQPVPDALALVPRRGAGRRGAQGLAPRLQNLAPACCFPNTVWVIGVQGQRHSHHRARSFCYFCQTVKEHCGPPPSTVPDQTRGWEDLPSFLPITIFRKRRSPRQPGLGVEGCVSRRLPLTRGPSPPGEGAGKARRRAVAGVCEAQGLVYWIQKGIFGKWGGGWAAGRCRPSSRPRLTRL